DGVETPARSGSVPAEGVRGESFPGGPPAGDPSPPGRLLATRRCTRAPSLSLRSARFVDRFIAAARTLACRERRARIAADRASRRRRGRLRAATECARGATAQRAP